MRFRCILDHPEIDFGHQAETHCRRQEGIRCNDGIVVAAEPRRLERTLKRRRAEGIRVNLNQLGEAIVGEEEAEARLQRTLAAVARPDVEGVSVKISSIASQLEPLAWEGVLSVLAERLRRLYREAMRAPCLRPDGRSVPKLVTLDMEEHRDLELTVDLFRRVLDEAEFRSCRAGIVLQAYLPDAHPVQRELVAWARERVERGGAAIRIRLVKGANLAMERCEAALRGWPQAPYDSKVLADANFKRMLLFGARPENARVAHVGIASHNVFDVALGLVVGALAGTRQHVGYEMLAGTAEPLRRALDAVTDGVLVYTPAVLREEFQSAIAYLIRRLDENTGPENFLRVSFGLRPGSPAWGQEERRFRAAWALRDAAPSGPRRTQDRRDPPGRPAPNAAFENEPDTDFSLAHNRTWVQAVAESWRTRGCTDVPCQVDGAEIDAAGGGWLDGVDPSLPGRRLYRAALADADLVDRAVAVAERAARDWSRRGIAERSRILADVAQRIRGARGDLIGSMMADGGKTIQRLLRGTDRRHGEACVLEQTPDHLARSHRVIHEEDPQRSPPSVYADTGVASGLQGIEPRRREHRHRTTAGQESDAVENPGGSRPLGKRPQENLLLPNHRVGNQGHGDPADHDLDHGAARRRRLPEQLVQEPHSKRALRGLQRRPITVRGERPPVQHTVAAHGGGGECHHRVSDLQHQNAFSSPRCRHVHCHGGAGSRTGLDAQIPSYREDVRRHGVQPDAPPGGFRRLLASRETGPQQQLERLVAREVRGDLWLDLAPSHRRLEDVFGVDPPTIVGDDDSDSITFRGSLEPNLAPLRFAGRCPLVRGLDAVIDCVADHVQQQFLESLDDPAIEMGVAGVYRDLDLAPQRSRQLARMPGE